MWQDVPMGGKPLGSCVGWSGITRLGPSAVVLGGWLLAAAAAPGPYEATRARPLFSPTRRPAPPPAAPAAFVPPRVVQAPAPPPAFGLSGVILGPGTSVALLTRPGSAEATRVALGARIDGWRVSEIRPRAVVLTLDDRSVTIALPDSHGPGIGPAPQL